MKPPIKVFSAIAKPKLIGKSFIHYPAPYFRTPLDGTLSLIKKEPTLSDLRALEKYFTDRPPRSVCETKQPFFTIYKDQIGKKARQMLEAEGWKKNPISKAHVLCIFEKQFTYSIPDGYEVRIGTPGCQQSINLHAEGNNTFFETDVLYEPIRKCLAEIKSSFFIINVLKGDKLVATANTIFSGRYAMLFSGSVAKDHRNMGLWKLLIGMRQALTFDRGVRQWALTTENKFLIRQGDRVIPFGYYSK